MIGQTISHYKISAKLGEGGMGVVYKAQDLRLDRTVAIKFLPEHLTADPAARTRFVAEAKGASAINHQNITTVYDIDEADGKSFIVMEYLEGKSLKDLAQEGVRINRVSDIGIQIAEGLQAAHRKEIVHRDIKSENILVTKDSVVKIMDFGLAKLKGPSHLTQTGATIGTVAYMSPEQTRGEEVDHRSDLFSLGVVLYELLTGKLPFSGEHQAAIIYSICHEAPEPLARYKAGIPEELQRVVTKTLQKDRNLRYQSAADLGADLKALRKVEEGTGAPVSPPEPVRRQKTWVAVAIALIFVVIAGYLLFSRFFGPKGEKSEARRKMLAVLPFENLGSPEEEYFATGITEEITTRLAKIGGLGVISHTSARKYKKTEKTLKQIGAELGADYILEGNIRWAKSDGASRIRINPQLIQVSDDSHLWAENYDAVLNDVFELQSSIAEKVAAALDVALLEPERRVLAAKPTENLEAYDFYLRGNDQFNRTSMVGVGSEKYLRIAFQMYERALDLDSNFALAHCQFSRVNTELYWHYDRKDQYLKNANEGVEKAFKLSSGLPEAYLALGSLHYHAGEYEKALEEFAIAQKGLPNNPDLLKEIGFVQRRKGKWDEAIASFKKAAEVDPARSDLPIALGGTYARLRKFTEAASYYQRAILLDPGVSGQYVILMYVYVRQDGNTKKARRTLEEATGKVDAAEFNRGWVWLDISDGNYPQALNRLNGPEAYDNDSVDYYLDKAKIYGLIAQPKPARACYDSARGHLEKQLRTEFENEALYSQLGIAYAGLGRKEEAIREGKKAVELLPVSRDAWSGPTRILSLARIYVMIGEYDAAVKELEYLLSIPSELTASLLRLDPVWAPLKNHPRIQKLLAGK